MSAFSIHTIKNWTHNSLLLIALFTILYPLILVKLEQEEAIMNILVNNLNFTVENAKALVYTTVAFLSSVVARGDDLVNHFKKILRPA